jgi:ketosteroid isomerase-like protein
MSAMAERGPIEDVLDAYRAAVSAKDVDAMVALYDEHVRVFDLWGRWSYEGAGAWRAAVSEWFGSTGSDRVAVEFDDVRIVAGDGVAVAHAFVTYRASSAEGEELRSMTNRFTWALRAADGSGWKVVHEHTSAPADLETARVLLQR